MFVIQNNTENKNYHIQHTIWQFKQVVSGSLAYKLSAAKTGSQEGFGGYTSRSYTKLSILAVKRAYLTYSSEISCFTITSN